MRSRRLVPSGTTETVAALPFAPTAAVLEDAIVLLARTDNGGAIDPAVRREAFAAFEALPAPGARPGRGWKHDYAKLSYDELRWTNGRVTMPAAPRRPAAPRPDHDVDQPALATENAGGLYHVGATFVDAPSGVDPRVTVKPFDAATAREFAAELAGVHGALVDWRADKFAALATAFQNCGAFVRIPSGVVLDAPIQLVFATAPDAEAVFPHVVVILEAGARATIIERHVGDGDPFVCGIVEARLGDGAELDYVAIQQTGEAARAFISRSAYCGRDATMSWHLAELGGTLARTVLNARLDNPGARAETAALFFNTGMQHVDLTTGTDHAVGPTTSDTVVRSAATDRGQGRYVGNIVIRPKAHGSDASLRDDALLLSKRAHIDSVPALEIAANDVKAFHGATVGSLDEDALFYVGSRGIPRPEALRLIALGFFEPVIARFPGEALRDEIRTALDAKIDDATEFVS
jgi:Fe-S cluster assembly protein SufD